MLKDASPGDPAHAGSDPDFHYFTASYEHFATLLTIWMFAAALCRLAAGSGAGQTQDDV
jgi:hypothetical protein